MVEDFPDRPGLILAGRIEHLFGGDLRQQLVKILTGCFDSVRTILAGRINPRLELVVSYYPPFGPLVRRYSYFTGS